MLAMRLAAAARRGLLPDLRRDRARQGRAGPTARPGDHNGPAGGRPRAAAAVPGGPTAACGSSLVRRAVAGAPTAAMDGGGRAGPTARPGRPAYRSDRAHLGRQRRLGGGASTSWGPSTLPDPHRTPPGPEPSGTNTGDLVTLLGSVVVAVALFLDWYTVTITAAGAGYLQRTLQGLSIAIFGHSLPGIGSGFPASGFSVSFSALNHDAGGWRWAILVLACLGALEAVLALLTRASSGGPLSWPHAPLAALIAWVNFVLVGLSLLVRPPIALPSQYASIGIAYGAYLGLVASLAAAAGATSLVVRHKDRAGVPAS